MIKYFYPEGATPIDEQEKLALIPILSNMEELNLWEQENIIEAYTWLSRARLQNTDIFTEKFICNLHKRMFSRTWKWAGEYRKTNKNIGCEFHLVPIELNYLLEDAKFWLDNSTYTIHQLALAFHHRLVKIHLFPNGNGRHARLMADCIAKKLGAEYLNWGWDMQADNDYRKLYISALKEADYGDYTSLFKIFKV